MYYIGYDIGSSSIKASLLSRETGTVVETLSEPETELNIDSPEPGWAEQDPDIWWKCVCTATKKLLTNNRIEPEHITGIGISYQMHGLVLINNEGIPLRKSIIWCDGRAVSIGQQAFEELGDSKCSEHLLNSPANFTASKLKWVKENEPAIYKQIYKFMLPGDYIAFKFSGLATTTISGLSEGIFWDFKENRLASWLLQYYKLNEEHVPEIVPTFGLQAELSDKGASESGLAAGTPILYRAGDQPNNALSLNVFQPGEVAATGGTSGVFYAVTDSLSGKETARVNNFAHVNYKNELPRIGKLLCINGAGIQYRWLLNNLEAESYEELNDLAGQIPVGSEGVSILPFGNGPERMLNNKTIGTRILGLDLNRHSKAHLCRAALEGIAFSFVYGMEILLSDGVLPKVIRAGNDNLFRSEIFSQTIADLIDQEIEIYSTTGAVGAAKACIVHHEGFENFSRSIKEKDYQKSFIPGDISEELLEAYKRWKTELELILKQNQDGTYWKQGILQRYRRRRL